MAPDMTALADSPVRRRRQLGWVAAPVALVMIGLIGVLATRRDASTRVAPSPLIGTRAPATAGATIDGAPTNLGDLRGRWVIVNFFATWCVPCREEHPSLVAFAERHRVIGDANVFGIVYADDVGAVRKFRATEGGDWPMLVDPDGRLGLDYGVSGVPESFLIDPGGIVVAKIVGGVRLDPLERLLADAKNPPKRTP
jgi:cytochrome c biogenesis protein CcmG/thiol:disulfide interchange protein DsbE